MAAPHDGSINSRLRMPDNKGHIVPGNSGTNDKKERNDKENLSHYQAHGYRADHTGSLTRKLNAATRKIEKLEADRKKAELREEFQSGVIAEYKKLVKPAQSKNQLPSSHALAHVP